MTDCSIYLNALAFLQAKREWQELNLYDRTEVYKYVFNVDSGLQLRLQYNSGFKFGQHHENIFSQS